MRKLKHFTSRLLLGANIASVAVMMLLGYSDRISPVAHPMAVVLGLVFPFILIFNLLFLIFWLVFKPKYALVSIVGLLICFQPVRTYAPLNIQREPPADAMKVLSYNVYLFATFEEQERTDSMLQYIIGHQADIVCLQEATAYGDKELVVDSVLKAHYQYGDTTNRKGEDVLRIYSRYPIIGKKKLLPSSRSASAAAFHLLVDGDTLTVVNCHLQSLGLSLAEKNAVSSMVHGEMERDSAREESRNVVRKLCDAAQTRALQADDIADYLASLPADRSILVCGDFNDGPISYTHHTIGRRLTDCFVASGNGLGISFHTSPFYVRIDNIMCSSDWEPVACKIDKKITISDHYPVVCWIKKRPNP